MNLENLPVNWFDFSMILFLLAGLAHGRKNGLSQELIPMLQWLAIVFGAAFSYEPAGTWLASKNLFSVLACYLITYLVAMIVIKLLFTLVKRGLGGKLIGSDVFGGAEYYLGMAAGMIRFACILLCLLALLNARYYSAEELRRMQKYELEVYGSNFFPGLNTIQQSVFTKSFTGPYIQKNAADLLIKPTPPEKGQGKRKEFDMP
jgi:uncharacterized membrane protein required for colicin V production